MVAKSQYHGLETGQSTEAAKPVLVDTEYHRAETEL